MAKALISAKRRLFKVLVPIGGLAKEALPGTIGGVRFDFVKGHKRRRLERMFVPFGPPGKRKATRATFFADLDTRPYAEATVLLADKQEALARGTEKIRAVIDLINFYADLGYGDAVFFDGEVGFSHVVRFAYSFGTPNVGEVDFSRTGPMSPVILRHIRKHATFRMAEGMERRTKRSEVEARLRMALRWAGRGSVEINRAHALAFFVFSLEALHVGPNPGGDIGYKVASRCAHLLGRKAAGKKDIFDNVRRLYNLRSEVVHRGNFDAINPQDLELARTYAKAAAVRLLSLRTVLKNCKSDSDLNRWLDSLVLGVPSLRPRKATSPVE